MTKTVAGREGLARCQTSVRVGERFTLLVLGQAVGHDEARHTTTDDDIVKRVGRLSAGVPLLCQVAAGESLSQAHQRGESDEGTHGFNELDTRMKRL